MKSYKVNVRNKVNKRYYFLSLSDTRDYVKLILEPYTKWLRDRDSGLNIYYIRHFGFLGIKQWSKVETGFVQVSTSILKGKPRNSLSYHGEEKIPPRS